jgi:hypothetical protein
MSQIITIQSVNFVGETANVLFKPDNDDVTINLGFVTLGNPVDSAFTGSAEGVVCVAYTISFSTQLVPNNNLALLSPTQVTGGTGDLIAYITYVEIDAN